MRSAELGTESASSCLPFRGVRSRRRIREELADDFFQGPVLDADVLNLAAFQQGAEGGRDAGAFDFELDAGGLVLQNGAVLFEVRRGLADDLELDHLLLAEAFDDLGQRAIVLEDALVDDYRTGAEGLDILHVVAGQQDGDLVLRLVELQEFLDFPLRRGGPDTALSVWGA